MKKPFVFDPVTVGAMRWGRWGVEFTTAQYQEMIEACLAEGLRDFDHADIYGNYTTEAEFGAALAENPGLRDRLRIITKCGIRMVTSNRPEHQIKSYDLGEAHITASVERSLKNFSTDYLDVLLLHRPDFLMDLEEIAQTFEKLHEQGKVLHFGVSNFTPRQFEMLNALYPLVTNQVEVSILHLDAFRDGTLEACQKAHVRPMAWSPMGGGNVFKQNPGGTLHEIRDALHRLADKYNCQMDQIILAFLFKHPAGIIPVLGTSKIERVRRAKEALDIPLSKEDWYVLWQATTGHEVA